LTEAQQRQLASSSIHGAQQAVGVRQIPIIGGQQRPPVQDPAQEGVSRLIDQSFLYKKSAAKVPEQPGGDPRELRKL